MVYVCLNTFALSLKITSAEAPGTVIMVEACEKLITEKPHTRRLVGIVIEHSAKINMSRFPEKA